MKRFLCLVFVGLFPITAAATDGAEPASAGFVQDAGALDLSEFLWTKRPIIVFADTDADPRFQQQLNMLLSGEGMLLERDVVVLTDTNPAEASALRRKFRPRGFQLILVGKDGGVKLRKPFPWSVRELTRSIDKMPLREREMREQRGFN